MRWRRRARHPEPGEDLLRVVCHELRTPVASMLALSRALAQGEETLDEAQRREAIDLVERHAEHLADVLASLRDVTGNLARTSPSRCDARVRELVETAAAAVGLPPERLDLEVADSAAVAVVDRGALRRILTNLLENAVRHADGSDAVTVRVRRCGGELDLVVADRGPGIGSAPPGPGHGLGLVIVGAITASAGGCLEHHPRPGGGLVVRVRMPC